jgi:uncharacterized repeat protein (TIGR03803 family)
MKHHRPYRRFWLHCSLFLPLLSACGGSGNAVFPPVADGVDPSGLIQGRDGNFYGTTSGGGQFNQGTVFRVTPGGDETVLYSFAGGASDGAQPNPGLIEGADGTFYGTTSYGGVDGCLRLEPASDAVKSACGTVFTITADGAEQVIYFFQGTADGGEPNGALVAASDGNFYGTTVAGGSVNSYCGLGGCGVVFKVTPAGAETAIYGFGSQTGDGVLPASLVQGNDGTFYSTTDIGGPPNEGTVFSVTAGGVETRLYSFSGRNSGENPQAPLVQGGDGNFYGTTYFGGVSANPAPACVIGGCGTVFKVTPTGAVTLLYSFGGSATDGAYPNTALVRGSDGNFFGTTNAGGSETNCFGGCGVIFSIGPDGTEATIYVFAGGSTDGAIPCGGLIQGSDGNFYGTTAFGGEFNAGIVFRITPAGAETVLHSFGGH